MELKTEQTQWKWWNGKVYAVHRSFFQKGIANQLNLYGHIAYIALCSNATRSTHNVLQHVSFHIIHSILIHFIMFC